MRATLADVAKRAGVSTATASRVLNNKMVMPISSATIARVRDAARNLEYRPNPMARALLSGRTNALGLFSLEMSDPHFAQMLEAAEVAARRLGYHLVVSRSLEGVGVPGRVDGLLVVGDPEWIPGGTQRRMPTVFVNGAVTVRPNMISWSDVDGMYAAARHLLDLGHRKIAALFCYGEEPPPDTPKVVGFRCAVDEAEAEWRPYWRGQNPFEVHQTNQFDNGYAAARDMLADWPGCTAIVARNDFIALGAMRALREAGIVVPHDMSVIGYTDSLLASCADPPLTSVRTPFAEAGAMAVELLVRAIESRAVRHGGEALPVHLTVRASTAPPRSDARHRGLPSTESRMETREAGLRIRVD